MAALLERLDGINRAVGNAVRWLALLMMLIQFTIVLLRYVFGISSIAINESVLYLHATLFMLAAGYTMLVNGHVRVDIFYSRLSASGQAAINLFGYICLLIPSMLTVLYWTWPSVTSSWAILEGPISVGGLPAVFLLKSLIPLFCVLLLLQALLEILRILSGAHAIRTTEHH